MLGCTGNVCVHVYEQYLHIKICAKNTDLHICIYKTDLLLRCIYMSLLLFLFTM